MKLKPLAQWVCDTCGEVIKSPEDGWLEWISDEDRKSSGFRIVHHLLASPRKKIRPEEGCYQYNDNPNGSDSHLSEFTGEDGLSHLLMFLDWGHVDPEGGSRVARPDELAELFRRVMLPHYEEARMYWSHATEAGEFADANQISPYTQESLKRIIREFGEGSS
jgi:hypothetical protein